MMKTTLYPQYSDVFANDDLQGIFYPLCSVMVGEQNLHFISHNGLWIDEQFKNENNQSAYFCFDLIEAKYNFKGDIRLYKGYQDAQSIFPLLVNDFEKNGVKYLQTKYKTGSYIKKIAKILPTFESEDLDLEYYLQTFYEFSINKLNYELNGKFGQFNHVINDWEKSDAELLNYDLPNDYKNINMEFGFDNVHTIGQAIGYHYFTDGNNIVLYYNADNKKVISFNVYS